MSEPKLTLGMVYTSASKPGSRLPSHSLFPKSPKRLAPVSIEPHTDKDDGSEKKDDSKDFLSSLCASGTENIVFEYGTSEAADSDQLVSPIGEVIYRLQLQVNKHHGEVRRNSDDHLIGAWNQHNGRSEKLEFHFAWQSGKWDFDPKNGVWLSSIGTLSKHEFKWMDFTYESEADVAQDIHGTARDGSNVRFSVKCIDDTDQVKRTVCGVAMDGYTHGTFTIPRDLIVTSDQLDEMVTVSLAVMDRLRDKIKGGVADKG